MTSHMISHMTSHMTSHMIRHMISHMTSHMISHMISHMSRMITRISKARMITKSHDWCLLTYPFEDILLVFLVLHEEADLPAWSTRISVHLPTLGVVPQGEVTDMKHLSRVYLCQNHFVPYHNLYSEEGGGGGGEGGEGREKRKRRGKEGRGRTDIMKWKQDSELQKFKPTIILLHTSILTTLTHHHWITEVVLKVRHILTYKHTKSSCIHVKHVWTLL